MTKQRDIVFGAARYCAHTLTSRAVLETGHALPKTPVMFFKPSTAVHDHGADVAIPKICQDEQADYEGELVRSLLILLK